jgi:alkylated DNA repair protein (DNA oxidative demethylase)
MTSGLFAGMAESEPHAYLAPGAVLLRAFALQWAAELIAACEAVAAEVPFRHMVTPGGQSMSAAMTNCGKAGWVSDRCGYRYDHIDPLTGRPWPPIPLPFRDVARQAAAEASYTNFEPDACLLNRYTPGARLSLHQDKDEVDFTAPIVSVSLGLPAKFLFGGLRRNDPVRRIMVSHGDVAVWGGPSRLAFHGIDVLKDGEHTATGRCRINLTFRKAL